MRTEKETCRGYGQKKEKMRTAKEMCREFGQERKERQDGDNQ